MIPIAISMKRGEKRLETQETPNKDKQAISGCWCDDVAREVRGRKPMALSQVHRLLLAVEVRCYRGCSQRVHPPVRHSVWFHGHQ